MIRCPEQLLDHGDRLLLGDARLLGHRGVGARGEREPALHEVQELALEIVERPRGAVGARADLGYGRSHRAASFAW
jgi:hypothetical protein